MTTINLEKKVYFILQLTLRHPEKPGTDAEALRKSEAEAEDVSLLSCTSLGLPVQ